MVTRWSCKFTAKRSFRLTQDDIDEAIRACQGPGGDGTIPVWALRIGEERYDLVMLRKEDFKLFTEGDVKLIVAPTEKTALRRKLSETPILLREEEDGD